jgi:hypothetical protein
MDGYLTDGSIDSVRAADLRNVFITSKTKTALSPVLINRAPI